jgi:hypothetical protein
MCMGMDPPTTWLGILKGGEATPMGTYTRVTRCGISLPSVFHQKQPTLAPTNATYDGLGTLGGVVFP